METFCKLKTSLNKELCQVHFYDFVAIIQHENNFLPTSKHQQAKVCRLLNWYLFLRLLHLSLKFHLLKMS